MTRYHDIVGYGIPGKLVGGVWQDSIIERVYSGDVLDIMSSTQDGDKVNSDVRLQQKVSVMADAFALENFSRIKYVMWMGTRWAIISVRVERPRLIISLGGVYNGPIPTVDAP